MKFKRRLRVNTSLSQRCCLTRQIPVTVLGFQMDQVSAERFPVDVIPAATTGRRQRHGGQCHAVASPLPSPRRCCCSVCGQKGRRLGLEGDRGCDNRLSKNEGEVMTEIPAETSALRPLPHCEGAACVSPWLGHRCPGGRYVIPGALGQKPAPTRVGTRRSLSQTHVSLRPPGSQDRGLGRNCRRCPVGLLSLCDLADSSTPVCASRRLCVSES